MAFCSASRSAASRSTSDAGGVDLAAAGGAERAGEVRDGVGPGKRRLAGDQRRRLAPRVALERVARRNGRQRVVAGGRRRGVAGAAVWRFAGRVAAITVERPLGRRVLRRLQVGVDLVVERVQLLGGRVVLARGGGRGAGWCRSTPATGPTRVNVCDGMWSACGASGAIFA